MDHIQSIEALEDLYGTPRETALRKVANHLTPEYRRWIDSSRFCVLTTVGPDGTDGSPRGDVGPVARALDATTLALPDWHGNNRIDSLRNIVSDGRVSLMFMVPGSTNVVRVNGQARVSANPDLCGAFTHKGHDPRSVILVSIKEVYFQCSRAILRSGLWTSGDESADLPTAGEILSAMTDGAVGGQAYDEEWPERAVKSLW